MNLQDFREQYSWLDGLSDESALNVLHETFYPKEDKAALAKGLGVSLKSEEKDTGGFWKDAGITALKGAISVPEAAVGLADMVTMGGAGRLAEEAGFRPKEAKAMLDEGYSDRQKAAFKAVQDAEGFTGKMAAALENPSVIAHSVGESIAPMLAGGVVARGLMGLGAAGVSAGAGGVGPVVPGMMARTFGQSAPMVAGAVGEGVLGAGSAAEQIRQQTPDGYLTGEQAALAGATGVATTAFGLLGGKIAQRMGIGDVDTMLVGAARDPGMRKGVVRSFLEGAASEGILEELPQSVSEQVLQNAALGKPLDEGVDQAAVLGLLSGGAMGGGAGAFGSLGSAPKEHPADIAAKAQADALRSTKQPETGALTKAVNAGTEAQAQKVEAAGASIATADKAMADMERQAPTAPLQGAQTLDGAAEVVDLPFSDRILNLKEQLADPANRERVRSRWGDQGLSDILYYAGVSDRTDIPERTQENMLTLAERLMSESLLTPIQRGTEIGGAVRDPLVIGNEAPAAQTPAMIGMNQARSGRFTVDAQGKAVPETTTQQSDAQRRAQDIEAMGKAQTGKRSAVAPALGTRMSGTPMADMLGSAQDPVSGILSNRRQAVQDMPSGMAPRTRTDGQALTMPKADPVRDYVDSLRQVNTPAAKFYVREFDAGRITPADVQQRMTAERGKTPDERLADAAAQAPKNTAQPGDILNPKGDPFKTLLSARLAAKKTPGDVIEVVGGYSVRPKTEQASEQGKWEQFDPGTGTLGVPRAEMPQVKTQHRGAMVNFLNARGVEHESVEVDAASLKPTQAEFSPEKVEKAKESDGKRSILISSDGHIIDGHHQAIAHAEKGEPIKAIKLDAPAVELIPLVNEFPSSTTDASSAADGQLAPAKPDMGNPISTLETPAIENQAAQPVAEIPATTPAEGVEAAPPETKQAEVAAITTADVARATGEAKEAITSAIDAMPAQQAQKIAAGFFPSMGLPRVLGKKHIKATITDKPLNLLAAASEFGAELSPEVKAALQAEFEGKVESVPVVAQAEVTKLTQAEAADLMEWVALGTKDGVTKHVLGFYESKADKDANRGRMTVATVTKGDRSATGWMVDGDDQKFGPLALAKKRGMEIGMAKAVADGFVADSEVAAKSDSKNAEEKTASKTPAKPAGAAVFAQSPVPVAPGHGITLQEAKDTTDRILDGLGMRDVVFPHVVRNPAAAGIADPGAVMPTGGTRSGKVYVFADNISDTAEVFKVVFHELFHLGLSQSVKPSDYITTMLQFLRDPMVRQYANEWKQSADGQSRLGSTPKNNWHALAVEEALAVIAEKINAERGGLGTKDMQGWVKRTIGWLANLAQKWGIPAVASRLRGMTYTDAEAFVQATILKGRTGSPTLLPDTRFRQPSNVLKGTAKAVVDRLGQNFSAPGKISWWDKTVGSMYHMAERYPAFKPVYEAAQNFINDVSYYGTEAANMAPRLLPKLDTWNDLMKSAISAADNDAVAAPVFEGTLVWARDESGKLIKIDDLASKYADLSDDQKARMLLRKNVVSEAQLKAWKASPLDIYEGAIRNRFEESFLKAGVVFTDAELKSHFKLSDDQVALYKEFRASADASLDNMTKADMLRIAGKDLADMRNDVMEADLDTAAAMVREKLLNLAREYPDREDVLTKAASDVLDRAAKAGELKLAGYAPLSRFGKYTVDVVVDGERKFFSLYESAADASRAAAQMRAEFGDGNVEQGTLSQREFELFQGITPESLELFGNMLGLDSTGDDAQDKAFQDYLRLTKSNRSALKRLIHRKGVDGYSEDVGRVLASFVYSNARQTAAALHIGDMGEAIAAIPKGDGELKDAAIELGKYVKEPREEAHALRGLLFAQYLGGSVASAMVNFTQPLAVSIPYLSQFGGIRKAAFAWRRAVSDMANGKELEPALAKAMKVAEEKGVVSPQEVHQLMAQARGAASLRSGDGTVAGDLKAAGQNSIAKMAVAWGKLFGFAEQINRRSTFIAAYRLAVDKGIADPAAFAEKAVNETQFVNNKGNKMKWGRGAIGATAMTFKSYSLNWLELMHRLATQNGTEGKWAAAYMLGALVLMSGAGGLPFAGDAEDVIDGIAQRLGYNFSSKKAKQQFLEDTFGKTAAGFIDKGITGIPGVPIDIAGRTGMGNLIPGTGLFLKKTDHTRDVMEFAGPAGDLITRGFTAADQLASGEPMKAAKTIAPKAVGNLIQGVDMASSGMYKDAKGYKVLDADMGEAIGKMIGFQPHSVANIQEAAYLEQRGKDFYNMHKQTINAKWANGIFTSDQAEIQDARDMVKAWNENNPDQRITVSMPIILKRVREMRKDKAQRIADTAPKAMRAAMREDLRRAATVD